MIRHDSNTLSCYIFFKPRLLFLSGQILPSKASPGKPDSLTCMYTATGHSSAILSLDVDGTLMITGSKGTEHRKSFEANDQIILEVTSIAFTTK